MIYKIKILTTIVFVYFFTYTSFAIYMDFKPGALEGTAPINSNNVIIAVISVIDWILGFTVLIAIIYLVYAGIMMIAKSANNDNAKKYKTYIKSVVIGILIILMAYSFVRWMIMPDESPILDPEKQQI